MNIYHSNKGYTLLFSIIVSSVVLSIAAFILTVSRRQLIISSTARDSTMAVYAADSAIQCAINAYYRNNLSTSSNAVITCNDSTEESPYVYRDIGDSRIANMNFINDGPAGRHKVEQTSSIMQFNFINGANESCAQVVITAGYNVGNAKRKTIIDARGYPYANSQPCNSVGEWNPRSVERAVRLVYYD